MAAMVNATDWSRTPLGPIEGWPDALRVAVDVCLASRFPMFVWWGPDLINIYNDAYVPMLGKRHPAALGRPARESWDDIWSVVGPQADAVMLRGEATWNERVKLVMERNGFWEDTYFTWSYSPIRDRLGRVGGLFCAVTEETERVRAEAERDRLAAQRQLALDAARMGWWHYDPDTKIATYDARCAEIFGVSGTQHPNENLLRRLHPDDLPEVRAKVEAALDPMHPTPYSAEFRVVLDDGTARWVEAYGTVTFEGAGKDRRTTSFVGTVADVTERRRAADQSRTILESITDAFFAVDRDWRFSFANRQAHRVLGRAPGDLTGKVLWEEYPGLVGSAFERVYRRAATEQAADSVTSFYPDHDRWYEVHAYPAPDGGISVYFRDATQRRRWEEALQESEARLRELADAMPQMVWVTRPDGYHEFYNRRWYEFTGVRDGSTDGEGWNETFHPDDRERAWSAWRHSLATGEPYEIEYRLRHRSGEYRWTLGRALPVRGADGAITRWFGTCTDIDALKRLQRERETLLERERAARAEAERASEAKSEFLATLSHEMRTPLTPVLLTVSLMETHPGLPPDLREDVATIRRNVELESRLISDLLDLTRIAKGKLQMDEQDVDLHLIVRSAIDICQREASARLGVELGASRHIVRGDATRLQQIAWNLISNAQKFSPPDQPIVVRTSDGPDGVVRVEVIDRGVGIDPAVLPKLFNAFEQGEVRAARQQAGLGLGLAISKRLAEAHGGSVSARSEGRGRGATFTLELPTVDVFARPARTAGPPPPGAPVAVPAVKSRHVLLVEDNEPTLAALTKLLRRMGHRVTTATSVTTAMAAAQQDSFDLVISDLGLPDGSGLDVIRRLRDRYGGRAIALTGYGMESDIAASRDAGFAQHLTKPVDLARLNAAIKAVAGE